MDATMAVYKWLQQCGCGNVTGVADSDTVEYWLPKMSMAIADRIVAQLIASKVLAKIGAASAVFVYDGEQPCLRFQSHAALREFAATL